MRPPRLMAWSSTSCSCLRSQLWAVTLRRRMGARSGWRDLGDMGRVVLEGRLRDDSRMAAHVTHVFGDMEPATVGAISELLDELDHATDEHPDVAIRVYAADRGERPLILVAA